MADKTKTTATPAAQEPGRTGKKDGPNPSPPAPISQPDDLKLISGIGPSVARKLHKAGIKTFAQIADMSTAELMKMESVLKVPGGVDWDAWKSEARAFMEPAVQGKKHDGPNPATLGSGQPTSADNGGDREPLPVSATPSDGIAAKEAVSETKSANAEAKPTAEMNASETAAETPDVPQEDGGKGDGTSIASPSSDTGEANEDDPYGQPGFLVVVKTAKRIKSRRRAGRSFSPEETPIASEDLRMSEFDALDGDSALDVQLMDVATGEIMKRPQDGISRQPSKDD